MNEQENGNTIRTLDLYTGGGGSLLAGRLLGWSCACAVEFDPYACAVLEKRQADLGEQFPIWTNAAKGQHDHRNQWPTVAAILRDLGPGCRFALLENSAQLCAFDYFGQILADLEALGFNAAWQTRAASSVDSCNHRRARLWIYCWR